MTIYLGETVRLKASSVLDLNGSPITTPSSIQIIVTKANGLQDIISTGMVSTDGTGNFWYDYNTQTSDPPGTWKQKWTISDGTITNVDEGLFEVNAP